MNMKTSNELANAITELEKIQLRISDLESILLELHDDLADAIDQLQSNDSDSANEIQRNVNAEVWSMLEQSQSVSSDFLAIIKNITDSHQSNQNQ